ncbi:MAG: CbiX/SirB N-terminal domain-containing protein [Candidatus Nanopelagicales bacterium]
MSELVVLLAHGSPDERSSLAAVDVAERFESFLDGPIVRIAYLQHNWPTLTAAIGRELDSGEISTVRVQPLLLSAATHALRDVPNAVAKAERDNRIQLAIGDTIGMDPVLAMGLDAQIPAGSPVVVAWAGGRTPQAQFAAAALAEQWTVATGREIVLAAVSENGQAIIDAVADLRGRTDRQPHIATFTLFPGVIADQVKRAGDASGSPVTTPLHELDDLLNVLETRLTAKPLDGTATA